MAERKNQHSNLSSSLLQQIKSVRPMLIAMLILSGSCFAWVIYISNTIKDILETEGVYSRMISQCHPTTLENTSEHRAAFNSYQSAKLANNIIEKIKSGEDFATELEMLRTYSTGFESKLDLLNELRPEILVSNQHVISRIQDKLLQDIPAESDNDSLKNPLVEKSKQLLGDALTIKSASEVEISNRRLISSSASERIVNGDFISAISILNASKHKDELEATLSILRAKAKSLELAHEIFNYYLKKDS